MQRFSYGDPEEDDEGGNGGGANRRSRRHNGRGELRNLDQYSSDEEFNGGEGAGSRRRKGRYNMRENRRTIRHYEAGNEAGPSRPAYRGGKREKRGGRDRCVGIRKLINKLSSFH